MRFVLLDIRDAREVKNILVAKYGDLNEPSLSTLKVGFP